jgi:hypothetical protein
MGHRAELRVAVGVAPLTIALMFGACDSTVSYRTDASSGSGKGGDYIFVDDAPDGGSGATGDADPPSEDLPDYQDPGCPEQPPPLEQFTCDPYEWTNGDCPIGESCKFYVEYPAEPCGQEVYGSFCYPSGTGRQGDLCNGGQDCAGGHVCVVTGSGTQCVRLCHLKGASGCPEGLVCEPIDVKGFGGCL